MNVIDASVLIAYLDVAARHHHASVEMLADAEPPLLVHAVTLAEVLERPVATGDVHAVRAEIAGLGVTVDLQLVDPVQLAELRVATRLRMPDCCVLAPAVNHGAPVLTFDEGLRAAARAIVG